MTWWAPFTFTAGTNLTAEDLNKYLYDNMNETLIGKLKSGAVASTEGAWFSTNGVNSIVGREIKTDYSVGFGVRTSTTYGVPTTSANGYSNPSLTVQTGTNALVIWNATVSVNVSPAPAATTSAFCGVAVSGASSIAASDTYAIRGSGNVYTAGNETSSSGTVERTFMTFRWFTGLTPGNNTFTTHIRCSGSGIPVRIDYPSLHVIPFG